MHRQKGEGGRGDDRVGEHGGGDRADRDTAQRPRGVGRLLQQTGHDLDAREGHERDRERVAQ